MKYIKITEEQTVMELMNHPYFSGKQLQSIGYLQNASYYILLLRR